MYALWAEKTSEFYFDFLCNCLSCFVTARITSALYIMLHCYTIRGWYRFGKRTPTLGKRNEPYLEGHRKER